MQIIKTSLYSLSILVGVVILVFILFQGLPGDPARLTMGQRTDSKTLDAVNKELGLDKPKMVQLFLYLNDVSPVSLIHNTIENHKKYGGFTVFNLGNKSLIIKFPYLRFSYQLQKPVSQMLMEAIPNTLVLAFAALLIAIVMGITLGVISAIKQNTIIDNSLVFISVLGISAPSFFAAILFQWLFAYVWVSFTGFNITGSLYTYDIYGVKHLMFINLILPAIVLGIRPLAIITQLTRSSMLDVMKMDYIRTAKAKGLTQTQIVLRHALRNALNPVVTAITGWFAEMLAGAFFIELVFGWNGIGKLTVDALNKNDFPVVMGSVLLSSAIFVVISLFTDVLYGIIDPRIRLSAK
jgi:ABC-type dipeptide/oligopeptide/nickel transport system permease component